MAFKDVFTKLNLSEKLGALRQKFTRTPKDALPKDALDDTASAAPELEPGMSPALEAPADSLIEAPIACNAFQRFLATAKVHARSLTANLRAKAREATTFIKDSLPKNVDDLKKLQPEQIMDRMRQLTGGRAYGTYLRLSAAAFAAYFLADTVSLFTDSLIPDAPPVPAPLVSRRDDKHRSVAEYDAILTRNIFSRDNVIPSEVMNPDVARKTTLPLNLIGTVVLRDETKSIATIEDRSQALVFPVRLDDVINDRIQIKKIEHLKVTFLNMASGQMEYVEIVEDLPSVRLETSSAHPAKSNGGVTQLDETHVQIDQKIIRDGMANLNEVLQQARAIPNFENGMPDGYKILQIVPGSVFDKFGIKNGDVIVGLNGETINDPGKALGLLNDLPNANHVDIAVKRGGRKMNMSYDIK